MRRWMCGGICGLWVMLYLYGGAWAGNSHGTPDTQREMQSWFGDAFAGYVVSGCLPTVPSSSLTFAAFACTAYMTGSSGELVYVSQPSSTLTLANTNGTHWLAVCRDTSSTVSGWTRRAGSHYVFQQASSQPTEPAGCLLLAQVTVGGGVITAVSNLATRDPQQRVADIRAYGAVPNDGSDSRVAIQAALDSGAPEVYIPKGTWSLSCSSNVGVSVPSARRIFGPGTLKWVNSTANSCRMLHMSGKTQITVEQLELDGNGDNAAAGEQNHGIYIIAGSTDVTIRDVRLHAHQGDAIYMQSTDSSTVTERITIENARIWDLGRQGITIAGAGARYIRIAGVHCRVGTYVTTSTSNGNCIHLETDSSASYVTSDIAITHNLLVGNGISLTSQEGAPWANVSIVGNTIHYGTLGSTALIRANNTSDLTIAGNALYATTGTPTHAIVLQDPGATADSGRTVITGNTILGTALTADAIAIQGTGSPNAQTIGSFVVAGNQVWAGGGTSNTDCIQITLVSQNVILSDNMLRECLGSGIAFRGGQYFSIHGNIIHNAGVDGITIFSNPEAVVAGVVYGNVVHESTPTNTGINVAAGATPADTVVVFGNHLSQTGTPLTMASGITESYAFLNYTATGLPGTSNWLGTEETITAGATITANACGGIKRVTAAGAVTTSTSNTFTAPAIANAGCMMAVYNTGANSITLDANSNFDTEGNADVVLASGCSVTVFSTGASGKWVQRGLMHCPS